MRYAVFLSLGLALAACDGPRDTPCDGDRLFGRPNANTGLDESMCSPTCACGAEPFVAPEYSAVEIDALAAWELTSPYAELQTDPYLAGAPEPTNSEVVCGVVVTGTRQYRLETFDSAASARGAGASPTHAGACGLCSPLADLAVYLRYPDLTEPVRTCGLDSSDQAEHLACLRALGFTAPCAQIWYFNTRYTRDHCLLECIEALGQPYHLADGTLNACLLCDEAQSGPVFKAVAGRTRRNTGIANAMCRPCAEVVPLEHRYE